MTRSEREQLQEHQHRAMLIAHSLLQTLRAWSALDQAGAEKFVVQLAADLRQATSRKVYFPETRPLSPNRPA